VETTHASHFTSSGFPVSVRRFMVETAYVSHRHTLLPNVGSHKIDLKTGNKSPRKYRASKKMRAKDQCGEKMLQAV
jgi:hypothetical protein